MAKKWGYELVGTNSAGNNAFFIRRDLLNERIKGVELHNAFTASKFRESRDQTGALTFISGGNRLREIMGMPVLNTETGEMEKL